MEPEEAGYSISYPSKLPAVYLANPQASVGQQMQRFAAVLGLGLVLTIEGKDSTFAELDLRITYEMMETAIKRSQWHEITGETDKPITNFEEAAVFLARQHKKRLHNRVVITFVQPPNLSFPPLPPPAATKE